MELYRSQLRRPRFTIAQIAALIAIVALVFRWPILILPSLTVTLILVFDRIGLSVIWSLIIASILGLVLGLALLMTIAH